MGNHPTRWMLTDKEYESVRKEDHSRRDDSSEVNLRLERNLEKYIFDNLSTLESGLNRVTEGDSRQRQVDSGRLDILGEDEDGRLVVIELKTGEAKRDALGQTMAYMADIDEEFPEREVRGIVVSDSFSDKLTSAVSLQPNVQLYHYDVQFTFEEVG
jgi:RecB family endonuclease NucS